MSFSVDQFMQVKCKFQLVSESESSDLIHSTNEQIRLCCSCHIDKYSTLIVLICSNEINNNHIVAYYIERRQEANQILSSSFAAQDYNGTTPTTTTNDFIYPNNPINPINFTQQQQQQSNKSPNLTFALLAQHLQSQNQLSPPQSSSWRSPRNSSRSKSKPKIIVKQIYYHSYNEDIVAICLNESGTKLVLVSASATIYILPIKNILLNLHAQQLRSSQGKSMYFYDATILNCCQSIDEPIAVACWDNTETNQKSHVIIAGRQGRLSFLNVDEKKQVSQTSVEEPVKYLDIVRDRFGHSLVITCDSFNQYRMTLEFLARQQVASSMNQYSSDYVIDQTMPTQFFGNDLSLHQKTGGQDHHLEIDKDLVPNWNKKPLAIKLHGNSTSQNVIGAASVFQRIFAPSSGCYAAASSISSNYQPRQRSLPLIFNHYPSLISVVDVLGINQSNNKSQPQSAKFKLNVQTDCILEPRLLRFYPAKQYYYGPQKPSLVCKLHLADPDEIISNIVLTDRFVAITTDRDRCLIYSRNCCNLRNPSTNMNTLIDPLVKEVSFGNQEQIKLLIKSPISNDQDKIIESFILITTRSIYSIEARQNCRDMYINLIDSHLAIKQLRSPSISRQIFYKEEEKDDGERLLTSRFTNNFRPFDYYLEAQKDSESNLLINNFLNNRDEVYERICYDSRAFSLLFKLDLNSLFEAYGDSCLQRGKYELANRFFRMAKFDHTRTIGKYIRLKAYKQTIDYIRNIFNDDNEILDEKERLDLSRAAFECLLAKTIVERSKSIIYSTELKRGILERLIGYHNSQLTSAKTSPSRRSIELARDGCSSLHFNKSLDLFDLCEHCPRAQESKLSATTLVIESTISNTNDEEEVTLTNNSNEFQSNLDKKFTRNQRLECEKALIEFVKNLLPTSLYSYAMSELISFNLIELVDILTPTDNFIHSLLRILIRVKDEDRIVFRDRRLEPFVDRLSSLNFKHLIKIDLMKPEFLEFFTSSRTTKALVKDISLTCEYLGYQHTIVQFRKYSFAVLCQLETYLQLIIKQNRNRSTHQNNHKSSTINIDFDNEDTNDGELFMANRNGDKQSTLSMSRKQKKTFERIFLTFLNACLEESTEDSCRIWSNYINFYLNHIGSLEELENDILDLIDSGSGDCRIAITLYKAIHRDENPVKKMRDLNTPTTADLLTGINNNSVVDKTGPSFSNYNNELHQSNAMQNSSLIPFESIRKLYNLAGLFKNEFLIRLLERTLDIVPQSADLDAVSVMAMC